MQMINEQDTLRYRVLVEGQVLNESSTAGLAEQFITTLTPDMRSKAQIVPVTSSGAQVLYG